MSAAIRQLASLLIEHEDRIPPNEWRTPQGLYSTICDTHGDERDPVEGALRQDAEIIIGLAVQLDRVDTPLEDIYREADLADPPGP